MSPSLVPNWIADFLTSGFFYRINEDQVRLGWGDFSPSPISSAQVAFCPFWDNQLVGFRASQERTLVVQEFRAMLEGFMISLQGRSASFSGPDRSLVAQSFQATQGRIQRGEIKKAVVIWTSSSDWIPSTKERATLIMNALRASEKLHVYGHWSKQQGVIGISPEVLFVRDGEFLQTMALAGSLPKAEVNERPALHRDPKELREHQMVITDITERLRHAGLLTQANTDIVELPTLFHLRTLLEIRNCKKSDEEIVTQLHPTAAMAQFPRAYGIKWMKDLPYQPQRGLHGGVVWFKTGPDTSSAVVAIRSLFWDTQHSWMTAGCGVVAESQEDREWREMTTKLASIRLSLGLE
jgi:menaquinone-specific isochorismate synthase